MSGTIYLNNLSYRLYKFLQKNGWADSEGNERFISLIPPDSLVFNQKFHLQLPIKALTIDFYTYMNDLLTFVLKLYPNKKLLLTNLIIQNNNLKHKFTDNWIIPEEKSKIKKLDKNDLYLPKRNKL
jgi:hypothetical protein